MSSIWFIVLLGMPFRPPAPRSTFGTARTDPGPLIDTTALPAESGRSWLKSPNPGAWCGNEVWPIDRVFRISEDHLLERAQAQAGDGLSAVLAFKPGCRVDF